MVKMCAVAEEKTIELSISFAGPAGPSLATVVVCWLNSKNTKILPDFRSTNQTALNALLIVLHTVQKWFESTPIGV